MKLGKDAPEGSTEKEIASDVKPEITEDDKSEDVAEEPQPKKLENEKPSEENSEEKKEENGSNRKIIKFDGTTEAVSDEKQKAEEPEKKEEKKGEASTTESSDDQTASREDLEQRRNILQNIKDFDFQIKKNQEDVGKLVDKIDNLSKDLDDLVSLYEIVSEQMNPFVGLSKVTKKRLESLENITNELDALKDKLSTIEAGGAIQTIQKEQTISSVETSFDMGLSDEEMDRIIELSFFEISPESAVQDPIDSAIDVYIENLKAGKLN